MASKQQNVGPPAGTRDFFGPVMRGRERAIAIVRGVFERYGFQPLETPAFERIEVLTGKYGADEKLIFKILKRGEYEATGEADMALRYDLTVPLARYIASAGMQMGDVFRRYQIGPVWRADRPAKGRFREFYQCDVDIAGANTRLADADVLLAVADALHALGLDGCVIRLNSRQVLRGLMHAYDVPAGRETDVLTAIDKLDKIGVEGVEKEMAERNIPAEISRAMLADFTAGNPVEKLQQRAESNDAGRAGWRDVQQILALVGPGLSGSRIAFDPCVARGLDYYTGFVFEVMYEKEPGKLPLSIAAGGRYDELVGMFLGRALPACGGSLGFERILMLLEERQAKLSPIPAVLVAVWDDEAAPDACGLAAELRRAGVSVELSVGGGKLASQLKYANRKEVPLCVFRGPDEKSRDEVAIKNLRSGSQQVVPRTKMVEAVQIEIAGIERNSQSCA